VVSLPRGPDPDWRVLAVFAIGAVVGFILGALFV